jgi:hypothetical protein
VRAIWLQFATPLMLLIGSTGILSAQELQGSTTDQNLTATSSSVSTSDATPLTSDQIISQVYIPLTLTQKYLYTFDKVAGPGALFGMGVHALIDDAMNMPHQWGTESGSLGLRAASTFGRSFLRENIAFGVRALDHEDPRYFRSGHGNVLSRVRYAAIHTFLVRNDSGATMPAYSMFVADSTMPFLAQTWRPEPFSVGRGFRGIGIGMSTGVASNVFNEFWPDIRAKLPRKLGGGVRTTWFNQAYLTPASLSH